MKAVRLRFVPPSPNCWRVVAGAMAVGLLMEACTTNRALAGPEMVQATQVVRRHDHVKCTMRDGSEVAFQVTKVEDGILVGAGEQVAVKDIAQVEVLRFSAGRTAALVLVGAVFGTAGVTLGDAAVFLLMTPPSDPRAGRNGSSPAGK